MDCSRVLGQPGRAPWIWKPQNGSLHPSLETSKVEELVSLHDSRSRVRASGSRPYSMFQEATTRILRQLKGHRESTAVVCRGLCPRTNCPAKRLSDGEAKGRRKQHCPCQERKYQEALLNRTKIQTVVASIVQRPRTSRTRSNSEEDRANTNQDA